MEAERRVERAQQLFESHRWEEALSELDAALSINPHNATWHAQRGFLLDELDRTGEAADAYQHALELEPGDRDVSMALGMTLLRLERYVRAIAVLEAVAEQYPDFEPAYCHRIYAYAELGQHDRAEQMFYLAQQIDDHCAHCFFHLGGSLASRGDTDRAMYCWKRVLDLEPEYVGVQERIGRIHRERGELDQARECFLHELRNDPGNTDLMFDLGQLHLEAGDPGAAATKFLHVVELEPDHADAHFALAKMWLRLGQHAKALTCLDTIRRLGPSDEPIGFKLVHGHALLQAERTEEASEVLRQAVDEQPEDPQAVGLLGDCYAARARYGEAADCYRRVLARDVKNANKEFKLGVCLFRLSRPAAAIAHWLAALRVKPDLSPAWNHLALAYVQLARWREAKEALRKACASDPENQAARELLDGLWRYQLRYYLRRPVVWLGRIFRRG